MGSRFTVEVVKAARLRAGDTIWAADDGDWLTIHRVDLSGWGPTVYRMDGSEAEFDESANVLRVVTGPSLRDKS